MHGVLRATRAHQDDSWPEAYAWIERQLIKRVGPPPQEDAAPLWGWFQCHDASRKRPDLRAVRHWYQPAEYVLIECELPEEGVMLSDYEAWHIILNGGYVRINEEDENEYRELRRQCDQTPSDSLGDKLRRRFYSSWDRVIDMEELTEDDWVPMEKRSIQACFWELRQEQIDSVKHFRAVPRKKPI